MLELFFSEKLIVEYSIGNNRQFCIQNICERPEVPSKKSGINLMEIQEISNLNTIDFVYNIVQIL